MTHLMKSQQGREEIRGLVPPYLGIKEMRGTSKAPKKESSVKQEEQRKHGLEGHVFVRRRNRYLCQMLLENGRVWGPKLTT